MLFRSRFFAPSLAVLWLLPALLRPAAAEQLSGRVVGISDGDTLTLLVSRREVRIRLHGIDAPEKAQPFGTRARQRLSALAFGKAARVDVRDRDRYGRTVGVVWVDRTEANRQLVTEGLAWAYRRYSKEYVREEERARQQKRGLWSERSAVPPWDWRRGKQPERAKAPGLALPGPAAPVAAASASGAVYVAPTSMRYHVARCRYLGNAGRPISRKEAQGRKLEACKVCRP